MKALLDSIEAAKTTESGAIVNALENWGIQRGGIKAGFRAFDHQLVNRMLVVGVKPKITDKWDCFNVVAESSTQAEVDAAFGTEAESVCKMDTL